MDMKSKMFRSLGKAYYKFITGLLQQENWKIQDDHEEPEKEISKLKVDKKSEKQTFKPFEQNLEAIVKNIQEQVTTPIQKKKNLKPVVLSIVSSENEDIFTCQDCNINFSKQTDLDRHNEAHNIQFELDDEYE
ncbi:hypothetical protein pb186bvf_020471 [Paramecium bursaria]